MLKIFKSEDESLIKNIHRVNQHENNSDIYITLNKISEDIKTNKDQALLEYTKKFDKVDDQHFSLVVTEKEKEVGLKNVSPNFIKALKESYKNIKKFHSLQKPKDILKKCKKSSSYGLKYTAIENVGLYVPGGRAVYPSTVLMNAVPAIIAGCKHIYIATPPRPDGTISPYILAAAHICGIETIYKMGGAQAVFALANGTETVKKIDKIVGPGNKYVTLAKQMVYGTVDIDKPAGPSEVLVIIEDKKYAHYAAAEMLAQMEHDPDSQAITVSENKDVLEAVNEAFIKLLPLCKKQTIIKESLKNSCLILCKNKQDTISISNQIASEHTVIMLEKPEETMKHIHNAGAIFCGVNTPVTLGDYIAGPNHVLPTSGTARFASPLGVMDFMKYSTILNYSNEDLRDHAENIKVLTDAEELDAHYLDLSQRL